MIAHFLLIRSDVAAATRWQPTNGDPFSHQNAIQRSVWDKLKDTGDVTARGPRGHVETLRNAARWSSDSKKATQTAKILLPSHTWSPTAYSSANRLESAYVF